MRLSPLIFPKMSADKPQYGSDSNNLEPEQKDINGLRQFIAATVAERLSVVNNSLQTLANELKENSWVVRPETQIEDIRKQHIAQLKDSIEIFNPDKEGDFYRVKFAGSEETLVEHENSRTYNPNGNETYFHLNRDQFIEFVKLRRVYDDLKTIVEQAERGFLEIYAVYIETEEIDCQKFLEDIRAKINYLRESLPIG